jgi:hypothetical protein
VQEHRCHEHDRGVEIEHDGDRGDEKEEPAGEHNGSARSARDDRSGGLEEPVGGGRGADEQEACDEDERGPGLTERGVGLGRARECRRNRGNAADRRDR